RGQQEEAAKRLGEAWERGETGMTGGRAESGEDGIPHISDGQVTAAEGDVLAQTRIPAFGDDWDYTILEGTKQKTIATGPGRYSSAEAPGAMGNFAIAGHRVGRGSPYHDADQLGTCDEVVIETATDVL